jgi:hypothetical protein
MVIMSEIINSTFDGHPLPIIFTQLCFEILTINNPPHFYTILAEILRAD